MFIISSFCSCDDTTKANSNGDSGVFPSADQIWGMLGTMLATVLCWLIYLKVNVNVPHAMILILVPNDCRISLKKFKPTFGISLDFECFNRSQFGLELTTGIFTPPWSSSYTCQQWTRIYSRSKFRP